MKRFHASTALLLAPALASLACAQSEIVPASPQSKPVAIINAIVHTATTASPVIENGPAPGVLPAADPDATGIELPGADDNTDGDALLPGGPEPA